MLCGPLSYEFSQFRISEALNLLVFFNPTYTIGLTLGCFLANIMSTVGPLDMVLGTSATLISCLIIVFIPTIVNAIIVPITIWLSCLGTGDEFLLGDMFWIMAGWVALGEFVCITGFGYPLLMAFTKTKVRDSFYKLIEATRNLDFKW